MDAARDLFNTLVSFKPSGNSLKTPEQLLREYCKQVLGAVERFHVDYKEKRERNNAILHDDDKKNLAKAVSGFANSGGGVLIWGIEDKKLTSKEITDVEQFTTNIIRLATQITDPVVQGIDADWLPSDSGTAHSGFALLYVPESVLPPHRIILNVPEVKNHYYVRSGDSFIVATHAQLEDMFGRRPKPQLSLSTQIRAIAHGTAPNFKYEFNVLLGIQNEGRGPARAPFLSVEIQPPYHISPYGLDGNGKSGLDKLINAGWSREHRYGASADVVIHSGVIHWVTLVSTPVGDIRSLPDLIIDYQIASEGIQTTSNRKSIPSTEFENAINRNP